MFKSWMWKQRSYREQFQDDEASRSAGGAGEGQPDAAQPNEGEGSAEQPDGEMPAASGEQQPADGDDELVIGFGDEAPAEEESPQAAPAWLKELRKSDREKTREIRELKAKLAEQSKPAQPEALPKPTLADCDYDEEVFETKLDAWKEQQRAVKAKQEAEAAQQQKAQQEWEAKRSAYDSAKASLKVSGFDEAEEALKGTFSELQQAVMLDAVDSADMQAKLVYALGNNPAELKRLSSITNPIKFAVAVAELEKKLQVAPRRTPPAPEKPLSGRTASAAITDSTLARLEAEAERTSDYSKVFAHKRAQRAKERGE